MTTRDMYTHVPAPYSWEVPSVGDARFTWEYDEGRARLLSLYQKGKDKQWDAQSRIDWTQEVDPKNPVGLPDEFHPLFGSPMWDAADESRRAEMRQHSQA
ncbi:MAG: aminobenzoate oxygenase, partial [Mycobacterium sp.]